MEQQGGEYTPFMIVTNGALRYAGPKMVKELALPDDGSVTAIEPNGFEHMNLLYSITVPRGVTLIGHKAFLGCSSLVSIVLPPDLRSVGVEAFADCRNLLSLTLPHGLTALSSTMLARCTALASINIPSTVTTIQRACFISCGSLTAVRIPPNVTSIETEAFRGCDRLTSLLIPASVTSIGLRAFACRKLTTLCIAQNWATPLNDHYRSDLIVFNAGLEVAACQSLSTVRVLYNRVPVYGMPPNAGSLDVVKTLREILWNMNFSPATLLEIAEDDVADKLLQFLSSANIGDISLALDDWNGHISVLTCEYLALYQSTWVQFPLRYVTSDFDISWGGELTYTGSKDATSVCFPMYPGLEAIGNGAFMDCHQITSLTLPDNITDVGENAFKGCESLTSIRLPNYVKRIGRHAFANCRNLQSIILPHGLTMIEASSFIDCSSLTHIEIPSTVSTIASCAFRNCDALTSLYLPGSVRTVGSGALRCKNLATLYVRASGTFFADDVFDDDPSSVNYDLALSHVHLALDNYNLYGMRSYGDFGKKLREAVGLAELKHPITIHVCDATVVHKLILFLVSCEEALRQVDDWEGHASYLACEFLSLHQLESSQFQLNFHDSQFAVSWDGLLHYTGTKEVQCLALPDNGSIMAIADLTFAGCTKLTCITMPMSVGVIGERSFDGCERLTSIFLPDDVQTIKNRAFADCRSLRSINIPKGLSAIPAFGFAGCDSLTTIRIPNNVDFVYDFALCCKNLQTIYVPAYVTYISQFAFGKLQQDGKPTEYEPPHKLSRIYIMSGSIFVTFGVRASSSSVMVRQMQHCIVSAGLVQSIVLEVVDDQVIDKILSMLAGIEPRRQSNFIHGWEGDISFAVYEYLFRGEVFVVSDSGKNLRSVGSDELPELLLRMEKAKPPSPADNTFPFNLGVLEGSKTAEETVTIVPSFDKLLSENAFQGLHAMPSNGSGAQIKSIEVHNRSRTAHRRGGRRGTKSKIEEEYPTKADSAAWKNGKTFEFMPLEVTASTYSNVEVNALRSFSFSFKSDAIPAGGTSSAAVGADWADWKWIDPSINPTDIEKEKK